MSVSSSAVLSGLSSASRGETTRASPSIRTSPPLASRTSTRSRSAFGSSSRLRRRSVPSTGAWISRDTSVRRPGHALRGIRHVSGSVYRRLPSIRTPSARRAPHSSQRPTASGAVLRLSGQKPRKRSAPSWKANLRRLAGGAVVGTCLRSARERVRWTPLSRPKSSEPWLLSRRALNILTSVSVLQT
jgi:hypothetical protein